MGNGPPTVTAAAHMHGDELAPLDWGRAFSSWTFGPVTTLALVLAAVAYGAGVRRLRRRHPHSPWPFGRTVAFMGGLAVVAAASMGSPAVYGDGGLFWMHMVGHLMFIMVAPWLVALGHPITLALRAMRGRPRRVLRSALRSRAVAVLTFPFLPLAGYAIVLVVVHLTGFMDSTMRHDSAMIFERLLYLGAGYLLFNQVLSHEPARYQLTYPLRLVLLFLSMMGDTLVGVVLLQSSSPPFAEYAAMSPSWGPGALADVHNGGALMWIGGDGIMFAMMMVLALSWLRGAVPADDGFGRFLESARQQSLADAAERVGLRRQTVDDPDGDEALAAYNQMLGRLHSGGGGRGAPTEDPAASAAGPDQSR